MKIQPFFSEFNVTGNFSTDYRKILKYQLSYKSVLWELSCSLRTDARADGHDEVNNCNIFDHFSIISF